MCVRSELAPVHCARAGDVAPAYFGGSATAGGPSPRRSMPADKSKMIDFGPVLQRALATTQQHKSKRRCCRENVCAKLLKSLPKSCVVG